MLGGAVEDLVKKGNKVTILARSMDKYQSMLAKHGLKPEEVDFLAADYFNRDALVQVLDEHIKTNGPFDQAVIWMRRTAIESLDAVMDILSRNSGDVDVFRVNGSAAAQTTLPYKFHQTINMHHIILGFKIENGESRWLTNDEISEGVISALTTGIPLTITGVIEPWDKRPGY